MRLIVAFLSMLLAGSIYAADRISIGPDFEVSVSPSGQDSQSCGTQYSPCQTIPYAVALLTRDHDFRSNLPVIRLMDGTYPVHQAISIIDKPVGGLQFVIEGNCNDPAKTVVKFSGGGSTLFQVRDYATVSLKCFTMESASQTPIDVAMDASQYSTIDVGNLRIGNFAMVLLARQHGNINCIGDLTLTGDQYQYFAFVAAVSTFMCGGNYTVRSTQKAKYYVFYRVQGSSFADVFPKYDPASHLAGVGYRCAVEDYSTLNTHETAMKIPGSDKCMLRDGTQH